MLICHATALLAQGAAEIRGATPAVNANLRSFSAEVAAEQQSKGLLRAQRC